MKIQNCCANCCQQFSSSLIVREIITQCTSPSLLPAQNVKTPQWKSINVNEAFSSIYKLNFLDQLPSLATGIDDEKEEDGVEIAICKECAEILTNLFKSYDELAGRRLNNSYIEKKIQKVNSILDEIQLTCTQMATKKEFTSGKEFTCCAEEILVKRESTNDSEIQIKSVQSIREDSIVPSLSGSTLIESQSPPVLEDNSSSLVSFPSSVKSKNKIKQVKLNSSNCMPNTSPCELITIDDDDDDCLAHSENACTPPIIEGLQIKREVGLNILNGSKFRISKDTVQCSLCETPFETQTAVANHLFSDHTDSKSNTCVICNENLFQRRLLKVHILRHLGAYKGRGNSLKRKKNDSEDCEIVKHLEEQLDQSTKPINQNKVIKAAHPSSKRKPDDYECGTCGRICQSASVLTDHIRERHTGEKLTFTEELQNEEEIFLGEVEWEAEDVEIMQYNVADDGE